MARLFRTCIRVALVLALAVGQLPAGVLAAEAVTTGPRTAPMASVATASTAPTATIPVSISTDTTLTHDRIWLATNSVRVRAGATLTIEPGTIVRFSRNAFLVIEGALVADGQGGEPILLTANSEAPQPGAWGGYYSMTTASIFFLPGSAPAVLDASGEYVSGSIIRNAVVEYGMGVAFRSASPLIEGSTIRHHGGIVAGALAALVDVLSLPSDTAPVIRGNAITDNDVLALYLSTSEAVVSGNVIAGNAGALAVDGAAKISQNLITGNRAIGSAYVSNLPTAILASTGSIHGNSVFGNVTSIAFWYGAGDGTTMDISGNFWGTESPTEIEALVYHSQDDFSLGSVTYSPFLIEPAPGTPASLAVVKVAPDDPVGPGLATITAHFSEPMDQSAPPQVTFRLAKGGTWTQYSRSNSGLPADSVDAVAEAPDGSMWFATEGGGAARFDGKSWLAYNTHNSGLGSNIVRALAVVDKAEVWFAHWSRSGIVLSHLNDGQWQAFSSGDCERMEYLGLDEGELYSFDAAPEPVDGLCDAVDIAADGKGSVYVATYGVMQYDGARWRMHGPESGLPEDWVDTVVTDAGGAIWAGLESDGVARLDGSAWSVYDLANSKLPSLRLSAMASGPDGSVWVSSYGYGLAKWDGTDWTAYLSTNSYGRQGPPSYAYELAVAPNGNLWAATNEGLVRFDGRDWTYFDDGPYGNSGPLAVDRQGNIWWATDGQGVILRWSDDPYLVTDNGRWLDDRTWQGTYDVSTLLQRGEYIVTVSGARQEGGLEVPSDSRFSFTVDYPGTIADFTAPPAPNAYASSQAGAPTTLYARWSAADPESAVGAYRYALGTTPGGTDIIGWTETAGVEVQQGAPALQPGVRYWLSVRARNSAGLWSEATLVSFVAGSVWPGSVYLPLASH